MGKHMVYRLHHFTAGPEIMAQQHLPALTGICHFCRHKGFVFFQKNTGIRQAELINGLLDISHQEAVLPFRGQAAENRVLHRVGVLVFIHHNLPVPTADLPGLGSGRGTVLPQQQIQSLMLQIPEIQHPVSLFQVAVGRAKPPYQGYESPLCLGRLGLVLQQRPGIS